MTSNVLRFTLILALTFTLALVWVLSFCPVRLKIGDYYFKQGKFAQAVNWYGKVVRKEGLKVDRDRGDQSKYEENLSKLRSAAVRELEERLIKVSRLLGFEKTTDLKALFQQFNDANTQPRHDSMAQQLNQSHNSVNVKLKEIFRKAKEELVNFGNISNNFKSLLGKKTDSKELDYLISMSYFFKTIIDDAEGNSISAGSNYEKIEASYPLISNERRKKFIPLVADKYLYQTPLNWLRAKYLYESQIKNGKVTGDLFLKLAYIHAKFNNFNVSYEYFRKAYELSKDTDLKKSIDYIKSKGIFLYPDDISLIPQKLTKEYHLLQEISFSEVKNLLNILGIKVTARSDGFIGKTRVKSPLDIIIRSAGYLVGGYGEILINGKNFSKNNRGYNIIVLNSGTGEIEKSGSFDTCSSKEDAKKMIDFINNIEKGKIVCAAVADDASAQLSLEEGKIFEKIGAKGNLHGKNRWGHGIIGVKGSKYGDAIESMSERPLEIYVINQES